MGVNGEIVTVADVPLMFIPGRAIVLPSGFTNVIAFLTDSGPPLRSTVDGKLSPVKVGGVVSGICPAQGKVKTYGQGGAVKVAFLWLVQKTAP